MKNRILSIVVIGIIVVAVFFVLRVSGDKNSVMDQYKDKIAQEVSPTPLDSQTNSDGEVSVTVTPRDQSDLEFEMTLSTHSVDLSEDLTKISILVDDDGNEYKPTEWQGDPPGGHHREGILRFGEIVPQPQSLTLLVRHIGGVSERKFEWMMQDL
ncbi:MAG TPA: hypothetical protein VJH89_00010 [Patescibacteria group bacterium]|nr:hypothetical protein [Patescibacteria group bacterium]